MNESNVTPRYLKRKFPNNPAMWAVIDFIKRDNGFDGRPAYVYIAYASDASGTGFTTVFDAALDYIAIKSTYLEITTPVASNFTGLWKKYKGIDGTSGVGLPPGGTTGQKLKKKSATDFDTEWKDDISISAPTTISSTSENSDNGTNHTHELDNVITAKTVNFATLTIDAKGRVTAASTGSVTQWEKSTYSQATSTGASTTTSISPGNYAYCLRFSWSVRNEDSAWLDDGVFLVWARKIGTTVILTHREILPSLHGITTSSIMSGTNLNVTINWGSTFNGKCLVAMEKVLNGVTN